MSERKMKLSDAKPMSGEEFQELLKKVDRIENGMEDRSDEEMGSLK